MKLSPQAVRTRYEGGSLKIALLGMSNIGKSHFAHQLQSQFGFSVIEVDAAIQKRLGETSMSAHAAWLGQPYSDGYAQREAKAVQLESEATSNAIDGCLALGNAVLDAPGSMIYIEDNVLARLKSEFLCIYLEANSSDIDRLKSLYYTEPKPLIWNDNYDSKLAVNPDEAVMASYENLLAKRSQIYSALADLTLSAQDLYMGEFDLKTALSF